VCTGSPRTFVAKSLPSVSDTYEPWFCSGRVPSVTSRGSSHVVKQRALSLVGARYCSLQWHPMQRSVRVRCEESKNMVTNLTEPTHSKSEFPKQREYESESISHDPAVHLTRPILQIRYITRRQILVGKTPLTNLTHLLYLTHLPLP